MKSPGSHVMPIQFAKGFMLSTFHGSVKFEVKTPHSGKYNKIQNKNKENKQRKRAKKTYNFMKGLNKKED